MGSVIGGREASIGGLAGFGRKTAGKIVKRQRQFVVDFLVGQKNKKPTSDGLAFTWKHIVAKRQSYASRDISIQSHR